MKSVILTIFLAVILSNGFAQSRDSVIYQSGNILLTQQLETGEYKLRVNENDTYENLKFVKRIYRYFQVLDADNQVFYIAQNGEKSAEVKDFMGVCGTVPHFTLSLKKTDSYLTVFEDETFFDRNNETPVAETHRISIREADTIVFINGQSTFNFTSNFTINIGATDPRTVICVKDGAYFTADNPDLKLDAIDFGDYHKPIKTMKNNRYGVLNNVAPKYKSIEAFNYYLAKAETEDGSLIYIDLEGNEYR